MTELYTRTLQKTVFLQIHTDYDYVEMWECQFDSIWKDLSKDVKDTLDQGVPNFEKMKLDPRMAFYGGRVDAMRLFYEVAENERIMMFDFTSLYPFCNKNNSYPVGHPKIITDNFKDASEYFGLIKCEILAPKNLYHALLPYKTANKLLFGLCHQCMVTKHQSPCRHTDEQRTLHGTWPTIEVDKAIELGYRVTRIHCVWHFDQRRQYNPESKTGGGGLFSGYIDCFLKLKQESSEHPPWCDTIPAFQNFLV